MVVVTDPPYGIGWNPGGAKDRHRGGARARRGRAAYERIVGDQEPFNPAHLLALDMPTVLFGGNHFADKLPPSPSWLVWDKRGRNGFTNDQADCEMAWTNLGGPARVYRLVWNGGGRPIDEIVSSVVRSVHPTEKPVGLMRWVIDRTPEGTVLDPYAGSGSTLAAAKERGRRAIGIEIEERYCETAAQRCSQEVLGLGA